MSNLSQDFLDRFDTWQKDLIFEKRKWRHRDDSQIKAEVLATTERQARLAEAVEGGSQTLKSYLLKQLGISDESRITVNLPSLPNPLTAAELINLPEHAEREVARHWGNSITPSLAAEPAFWTLCHAIWIGEQMFGDNMKAVFFAGGRGDNSEAQTRNLLRRMGGLRRVRGNISPLTDCPLSVAWWRYRLAQQVFSLVMSEPGSEPLFELGDVHKLLRIRDVWDYLVGMSLRRVTVVSAPRAQAAIVTTLLISGRSALSLQEGKMARQATEAAVRAVAGLAVTHSLHSAPWPVLIESAQVGLDKATSRKK